MTGGPRNALEALAWIREAARQGRYLVTAHLTQRCQLRQVDLPQVLFALRRGTRAEPYSEPPQHGGTCWRVHGQDDTGRPLAVGVEAYRDKDEQWAILCTVISPKRTR